LPIGARLHCEADHLLGYRIDERNDIEITEGNTPQYVDLPATPAGGIYGTIVRSDGTPASTGFITVVATKLPPGFKSQNGLSPSVAHASSDFLASLPLGGRYIVLAREFNDLHTAWAISPEISLDDSHPIEEIRIELPRGRTVPIKIVDPDG